ncbi:heterokaryon incompatibility protein-domain-containing protein [Hypomontagnella monticulosa]|nr:heterokaryon incompatibility protein-domain-containing protein [Hypomontagnella monticulosa]
MAGIECTFCLNPEVHRNPKLCQHCQCWDNLHHMMSCSGPQLDRFIGYLCKIFDAKPPNSFVGIHFPCHVSLRQFEYRSVEDIVKTLDCLVCQTLVDGLQRLELKTRPSHIILWKVWPGEQHVKGEDMRKRQGFWTSNFLLTIYAVYADDDHEESGTIEPHFLELELSYTSGLHGLDDIKLWDRSLVSLQHIKDWLSYCKQHHRGICDRSLFSGDLPPGFRVIDISTMSVIEPQGSVEFVALSYQWATATAYEDRNVMLLRDDNDISKRRAPKYLSESCLPEVIWDSIKFCQDIGQRYLWVDRLCVYQDDDDKDRLRQVQIDAMDAIYSLATLTLVACANGVGVGLPGVSGRARSNFKNNEWLHISTPQYPGLCFGGPRLYESFADQSSWNTRGWTFQERAMSRRRVFFGHSHCLLSCCHNDWEESFKYDLANDTQRRNNPSDVSSLSDISRRTAKGEERDYNYGEYQKALRAYTARSLGHASDVFNAFAGVNNILMERLKTTSIFGLPRIHFLHGLLWYRRRPPSSYPEGEIPKAIPSWSWASGFGAITDAPGHHSTLGNLVRFWYSENGIVQGVVEATSWFDQSPITVRYDLSVGDELKRFYENTRRHIAKWRPSEPNVWETCPHNPLEAINHRYIMEESKALAEQIPGCLVFNTTEAPVRVTINRYHTLNAESPIDLLEQAAVDRGESLGKPRVFDIVSDDGVKIGYTHPEAFPENHKLPSAPGEFFRCHAIVIGASEKHRKDDAPPITYRGRVLKGGSLWSLHVMLVDKNDNLSTRLGLGMIYTPSWEKLNPTWKTIFLV